MLNHPGFPGCVATLGLRRPEAGDAGVQAVSQTDRTSTMEPMRDRKGSALAVVSMLWAGILSGVSFLATPAKFLAPSLTLPVAVDVGRSTFAVLNRVELGCAVLSLGLLVAGASRAFVVRLALGLAALGLLLETLWLLPALDERAGVIIDGGTLPSSGLHDVYVGIEAAKIVALLVATVVLLRPDEQCQRQ